MSNRPDLTVVLASPGPGASPERAIEALLAATRDARLEVILVGDSATRGLLWPDGTRVTVIPTRTGTLVPVQWGEGLRVAKGNYVGFLSTDFLVHPTWARRLLTELERGEGEGVSGAAGGIGLAPGAGPATAGVYLARYSAFLPGPAGAPPVRTAEIPGDTAIYRREDLLLDPDLLARGFWEVEFHARLRSRGRHVVRVPDVLADLAGPSALMSAMTRRYRHARLYGGARVRQFGHRPGAITLVAPFVPWILTGRAIRRAVGNRWGRRAIPLGAGPLLLLCLAWAWGEVRGAWSATDTP